MNEKFIQRGKRREYLIEQAAMQRIAFAQSITPWRKPLAITDFGLAAFRYIKSHPTCLAGGSLLLMVLRPRRVGRWLRRGLVVWQVVRKLSS
jgi:hypothetical protein